MKISHWRNITRICYIVAIPVLVIGLAQLFLQYGYFRLPEASDTFDCDDATLLMAERFSQSGIPVMPVLGNLDQTGETYLGSDHVWLSAALK